jgi:hypothetical protein
VYAASSRDETADGFRDTVVHVARNDGGFLDLHLQGAALRDAHVGELGSRLLGLSERKTRGINEAVHYELLATRSVL